ncbi:YegP family protein [Altererythrobacter sp. Root672]|uniref:DUF1508 domain-containing protein n=1 Tax=Altererythrobacter sp. Root672 TaxID=1736584 RepID=UPI0009E8D3FB
MRQMHPGHTRVDAFAGRGLTTVIERPLLKARFGVQDRSQEQIEPDEPGVAGGAACQFDVYRADQVRLTATQFSGGDWRWQLLDKAGQILVEAGGYPSEDKCREAVRILQRYGAPATSAPTISSGTSVRDDPS